MSLCNIFTHHIYKESNTFYSWSRTLLIRCHWQFDCRLWVWALSCCSLLAFIVGYSMEAWAILLRFSRQDRSIETFHHLFIISCLLINVCTVLRVCAVRILSFISLVKKPRKHNREYPTNRPRWGTEKRLNHLRLQPFQKCTYHNIIIPIQVIALVILG